MHPTANSAALIENLCVITLCARRVMPGVRCFHISKVMESTFKLFLYLFAFLMSVQQVTAEEWRGIVPLSSTRADVIRLFGQCLGKENLCEFTLTNEDILIVFSRSDICLNNVPPDTVLLVERELRAATTLAALGLDQRRFKSFDPSWPRNIGYRGYIDEQSGLLLKAFKGEIFQIDYIGAKEDRHRCPSYYRKPRDFVQAIAEHAPIVTIRCPKDNPTAGERIALIADHQRSGLRIFLEWHVSGGRIVEGQNTRHILVDTTDLGGQAIKVTVERSDTLHHVSFASCNIQISEAIKN